MNLHEFFAPNGPLAAALGAGYQHRREQVAMAQAVEHSVERGRALLADAPTGTGKSLAYLVRLRFSSSRFSVSSCTSGQICQLNIFPAASCVSRIACAAANPTPTKKSGSAV